MNIDKGDIPDDEEEKLADLDSIVQSEMGLINNIKTVILDREGKFKYI